MQDWIRNLLRQLGIRPDVVQGELDHPVYLSDLHSVPCMSPGRELVQLLGMLHDRNLLNIDKGFDSLVEGQVLYICGIPMKLKYIQRRRLVFELPSGKRFRQPYEGHLMHKKNT
jgi:hypothetical protein